MSLLRCEVIKTVVHTRVKSIILVLHYALTEVAAFDHSIHIVFRRVASGINFTTLCKLSESLPSKLTNIGGSVTTITFSKCPTSVKNF